MNLAIGIVGIIVGIAGIVFGGWDDSPGAQLMGVLVLFVGVYSVFKHFRERRN